MMCLKDLPFVVDDSFLYMRLNVIERNKLRNKRVRIRIRCPLLMFIHSKIVLITKKRAPHNLYY